jgi:hypothetical protein
MIDGECSGLGIFSSVSYSRSYERRYVEASMDLDWHSIVEE